MSIATRTVRAPRGTELHCLAWPQEAAFRMIQNNLDPDVAEKPDELIVYGATGRAARSWRAFDRILETLRRLRSDETPNASLVSTCRGSPRTRKATSSSAVARTSICGRRLVQDVRGRLVRTGTRQEFVRPF